MHTLKTFDPRHLLVMLVSAAALLLVGCGGGSAGVADDGGTNGTDLLLLAADPLEGVPETLPHRARPDPEERIAALAEELGLDEQQTLDLLAAHEEFRTGVEALRDQVHAGTLTHAEAREEAEVLREAFEAELQLILTPEQYDELQSMRQNHHRPGRGHRHRGPRWADWLDEIGADEEQVEQILDALESLHADMRDLHDQVRSGELTQEEGATAAEELRAAFDVQLQTILTAEQYAALEDLRPDRCNRVPEPA